MANDPFITGIAEGAFAEDFSRLVVTFSTANSKKATYQFLPDVLASVVSKLSQMVMFVQSQTLSKGDHFVSHAVEAVDATATAVADRDKIVLAVKTENKTLYEFAFSPPVLARLREEIGGAEKKIRERPSHARH